MYCEIYMYVNAWRWIWSYLDFYYNMQIPPRKPTKYLFWREYMRLRLKIHSTSHTGIYRFSSSFIFCVSNTVTSSSANGREYLWWFFLPSSYNLSVLWPSETKPFGTAVWWSKKMPPTPGRKDKFWSLNYLEVYRKNVKIVT